MKNKVLLLSDPNNPHTLRWAEALASNDIHVCVFGLDDIKTSFYENHKDICVYTSGSLKSVDKTEDGRWSKLRYLRALPQLKRLVRDYKPDTVHAHYASSYGLLGVLSGFHPLVLSVWGSDIFCFPKVSYFHKSLLKYVLKKSDYLLSTSHSMAEETKKYTNRDLLVIPFGVDCNKFYPNRKINDVFTIGCTKTLAPIYGIDVLIRAFSLVIKKIKSRLILVGDGPEEKSLRKLVDDLGIKEHVSFEGRKDNDSMPNYYNQFDVAVFLSKSESFGVVAIEALACGCPLIVSKVAGFLEVVPQGAGIFVDGDDVEGVANSLLEIALDNDKRGNMGSKGRDYVISNYQWKDSVSQMVSFYEKIL